MKFDQSKPLTGYQCAQTDDRYLELRMNLLPHELEKIDDHLKTLDISSYGQYLNAEVQKLVDSF